VEKSRWRHIRLAMKPRYLGNHASHIICYFGSLSGSHARSFWIRHEKLPEAPAGGGLTMTSYPVGNKTSLSQKPCIAHKKLLWITIRKSYSLFQKPSWKIAWSAPRRRNHDDVISGLQWNLVISETMHRRKKLLWITIMKMCSLCNFIKKTANINLKNLSIYICY